MTPADRASRPFAPDVDASLVASRPVARPLVVHYLIEGESPGVSRVSAFLRANRECPDVVAAVRSSWFRRPRYSSNGGVCRIGGGAAPSVLLFVARAVTS